MYAPMGDDGASVADAIVQLADVQEDALIAQGLTPWMASRDSVMDLGRDLGLKVGEPSLTRYDLYNADECFLTGTGAEIIPVVKIDGRGIGTGQPGPLSQQLIEKYHALTKVSGEPI